MLEQYAPLLSLTATAVLVGYVLFLRHIISKQRKEHSERLKTVNQELQAIGSGSMGVGRKLIMLEKQIAALKHNQDEMVKNDPNRVSYTEASRLVELGADVEDLMNSCGISRPEAELVTALSQKSQSGDITVN
ncbi:DUF2802 domain-containing protein [Alkalimarinus sediminis]|uniref:DUF2802 domain-containing protein n=1 Tax=Alkalimarinus sediminis TaxID=1632866 RepID=A0A9E8HNX2_9ALTE|nr:DUF2802 domain-containing protein [Alkalimarinus sediminis]UZW76722.1 DUF2802 domain-containing protein [Alkalimarinus sediminis]